MYPLTPKTTGLCQGLLGWWYCVPTSGGPIWRDLTLRTNHGVHVNSPTFGPRQKGYLAFTYNGSTQYTAMPWGLVTGASPRTLGLWFAGTGTATQLFMSWGTNAVGQLCQIGIFSSTIGALNFAADCTTALGSYNDGNWHSVYWTYDSTTIRLYLDGTEANNAARTLNTGSSVLNVGRSVTGGNYSSYSLDDAAIWDRVLSPAEISQLHIDGQCRHIAMLRGNERRLRYNPQTAKPWHHYQQMMAG